MPEAQAAVAFPLSEPLESRMPCKICGASAFLFDVVDFNKHCSENPYTFGLAGVPVYYYCCSACGLIYTTYFDKWSDDQFANFVYNADYIKVDSDYIEKRPTETANRLAPYFLTQPELTILDYGSGSGLFAERLREHGVSDVESYDPFASPERPTRKFDIITCIEVIEHSPFPLATLADMMSYLNGTGVILLGTALQPDDIARTRAGWWYIGPRNGHVTIFNEVSLTQLAEKCGMVFYPGEGLHGLCFPDVKSTIDPSRFGAARPLRCHTLYAPDHPSAGDPAGGWHDLERGVGGCYRWTATRELTWQISLFRGSRIRVEIPFVMEVQPGFAEGSVIMIGDKVVPVRIVPGLSEGLRMLAHIDIDYASAHEIVLRMPEPKTPSAFRQSSDQRFLGIAVSAPPTVPRLN
jgi:SAM-dependent methyltransferase